MLLTPRVIQAVRGAAAVGVPECYISAELSINYRTWQNWKAWGKELEVRLSEEEITEKELNVNQRLFLRFFRELTKAQAQGMRQALSRIRDAGEKQWQAEAWFLERTRPDLFGRHDKRTVEIDANVKSQSVINAERLPIDLADQIAEELERDGTR